jgi:hypothetical protein
MTGLLYLAGIHLTALSVVMLHEGWAGGFTALFLGAVWSLVPVWSWCEP